GQKCGGRFGFVSSHAANSFAILSFSFLALKFKPRYFHFMWLLAILVGYSRIYLGVHFPGDIAGGMLVGILWGFTLGIFFRHQKSWGQSA
ncbi:MAG: phosphatase PAP2 family protein, partial [Bdellovibrionales bacterium]|nr:phosphatase PAP2 family protein [Bdellovibrionales bacterium]